MVVHAVCVALIERVVEGANNVEAITVVTTDCVMKELLATVALLKPLGLLVVPCMLNS